MRGKNILVNRNQLEKLNEITNQNFTISTFIDKLNNTLYYELSKLIDDMSEDDILSKDPESFVNKLLKRFKITETFCQNNFNCTLAELNNVIDVQNVNQLIDHETYLSLINHCNEIIDQFFEYNDYKYTTSLGRYLFELDNDDKIGKLYGRISYNPQDEGLRSGPIVIYKDLNTQKNEVLIGKFGEYHRDIMPVDLFDKVAVNNAGGCYISYCYFYSPYCAYIEEYNGAFRESEVIDTLKNDPRIKKVYLSPGRRGGNLRRLAKKN